MIYLISDSHMGHAKIIEYVNRPYISVEQMDEDLIERWNLIVQKNDIVYHLGDFTLGGPVTAQQYFGQLKGTIRVIGCSWHHDRYWLDHEMFSASGQIVSILPPIEVLRLPISVKGSKRHTFLTLSHYPMVSWADSSRGGWHAHGHTHKDLTWPKGSLVKHVGVDTNDFTPISLDDFALAMNKIAEEND